MIEKVKSQPSQVTTSQNLKNMQINSRYEKYCKDTIRYGNNKQANFYEILNSLFQWVLSTVKYYFLYCFFDEDEDQSNDLKAEFETFQNYVIDHSEKLEDSVAEAKVKKKYQKLSKGLQRLIKKEIKQFFIDHFDAANASKAKMKQRLQEVLENPFMTWEKEGGPQRSDPAIFIEVLFKVQDKIRKTKQEGKSVR